MSENAHIIPTVIVGLATTLVIALVVFFKFRKTIGKAIGERPREKLVQVEFLPDRPFELRYTFPESRIHRVFMEYRMHSVRTGGTVSRGMTGLAGLALTYECHLDGQKLFGETLGKGTELPCQVDRKENTEYMSSTSSGGSDYTRKGTFSVLNIGPKPVGSEFVITGAVKLNQFTEASLLELFISH